MRRRLLCHIVISLFFVSMFITSCGVDGEGNSNFVTLTWDPPSTNVDGTKLDDLAGFKIYYGTVSGEYTEVIDINDPDVTQYNIENLPPGTYYFAATTYDKYQNESSYSNEVNKIID